ncbi:MAG TPA: cytochrome c biogenesis protein CcsA [Candidatus Polarisedimenticolia bacterium]|nr:cytochrome c biogenesis protein CcsA [Candidatus Polarisedimenticolia bacterium]
MDAAVWWLRGALVSYAAGSLLAFVPWRRGGAPPSRPIAPWCAGLGALLHSVALLQTGWTLGRCPLGTLPEVLSVLAWAFTLAALWVWWRSRLDVVLAIEQPLAFFVLLLSQVLPRESFLAGAAPSPAFVRFHLTVILFGVAALSITFAASILYLAVDRALKAKRPIAAFRRLPSLEACDLLAYRSLAVAFALLTLGILSGAVINDAMTGAPWTWRREETLAILAWILLGAIVLARLGWGWRGRRASILMVLGFGLILLRMLGF